MSDTSDDRTDSNSSTPYICYAAMPRQLLIRADGSIGKCTVMLNDDRNKIGKIDRNGDYTVDNKKFDLWIRGFVNLDALNIGCPAVNLPKIENHNNDIPIVEINY